MPKTLRVLDINLKPSGSLVRSVPISSASQSATPRHDLLPNRGLPNQHPIEAITNLRGELDQRVQGAPDGEVFHFPLWEADNKIGNSVMVEKDGKIGVHVEDPGYPMDIDGLVRLAGLILGGLADGPYMTESNGDLNLSNPEYRMTVGAKVLHLEGIEELALTSWGRSLIWELTDRNTANTYSLVIAILPDGFYFVHNGDTLAVLDKYGKLWLKDPIIGDLSTYRSEHLTTLKNALKERAERGTK